MIDEKPLLAVMLKTMKHRDDEPDYIYPHFEDYWTKEDHIPYFIFTEGEIAGFVLLDTCFWILPREPNNHDVAELYIEPAMHRRGIDKEAMFHIFEMHPGNWEIRPLDCSLDAQGFGEHTLDAYTRGNYKTTCFGKYKRPLYTMQAPTVIETGHEIVYRGPYGGF